MSRKGRHAMMDWKLLIQLLFTVALIPLLQYIFKDKLAQIKESNDAVKKSMEEMKTSTTNDIKGMKDSLSNLDQRLTKEVSDLRTTSSRENAEIRTSITTMSASQKTTNDELIKLDRNVLEYKGSITGQFAALSDKFIQKGDYAREQVTVDNRLRALDNRIAGQKTHRNDDHDS